MLDLFGSGVTINRDDVLLIIDIQDEYEERCTEKYNHKNIEYIISNLKRFNRYDILKEDIIDIFEGIASYDRYEAEK